MTDQELLAYEREHQLQPLHDPPEGERDAAGGLAVLAYWSGPDEGGQRGPGGGAASPASEVVASASTLATTLGITTISQTRSMSGAESPVPALGSGLRSRNALRGKRTPSARAAGPSTPDSASSSRQQMLLGLSGVSIPIGRAFSRSPLLSTQMVSPSAIVVTQTATGRGRGCAAVRPNDCDCGCCLAAAKGRPVQCGSSLSTG
jgi:hypothetical protein